MILYLRYIWIMLSYKSCISTIIRLESEKRQQLYIKFPII